MAPLLLLGACVPLRSGSLDPGALRDWPSVLAEAQADAAGRRYADADRVLADFARRYPGTPEAAETSYWRGLMRLDPLSSVASVQAASASLDEYLNSGDVLAHRTEAETLRRLAGQIDALDRVVAAGVGTPAVPTATVAATPNVDRAAELKARDAEIQRLKDELAKANDELERIKRRLTQPTKPPS